MKKRPLSAACLFLILLLYLGTVWLPPPPFDYEDLEGERISLTGSVYQKESAGEGERGGMVYLRLSVPKAAEGKKVICYLKPDQKLPETGSSVTVAGRVKNFVKASNPGQFDAESYYHILKLSFQLNQTEIQEKSQTYDYLKERLFLYRESLGRAVENALPPKEASIMKTMLLGEKSAVDREIKGLYQRSGIAHVLAISGLHISLIGMLIYRFLRRLGLPMGAAAGIAEGVVLFYGLLTGFSVSSLRAVVMFGIHMAALMLGRTYDLVTAAFLSAALILLAQPFYLYHSGFLFSFGCVFAIGFLLPVLSGKGMFKRLLSGGAVTVSVLPVQLWYFYQFPLLAFLLNLLVIPLMSLLVPGGLLLLLAEKLGAGGLVSFSALFVTGALGIYEEVCLICERLPFCLITPGKPAAWQIVFFYLLLFFLVLLKKRLSLFKKWALVFSGVLLLCAPFGRDEGKMSLTFLDVGQGDCIHIKSERGLHYLVDGGSSSVSGVGTYRIIPYLKAKGASKVEAVFVTHPDEDHCSGIRELLLEGKKQGISINRLYLPDVHSSVRTESYLSLEEAAVKAGVKVSYISAGWQLKEKKGSGLSFWCFHPPENYQRADANEFSTVLLIRHGNFQALLTGDIEGEGEELLFLELEKAGIEGVTVLKAAHHGSAHSTKRELLSLLTPSYTVISCGKGNRYGHPHEELLQRLWEQGTEVSVTYETGAVTFLTDGKRLWVEKYLQTCKEK